MRWRAFGQRQDLDLDFGGVRDARRSALVTRVLVACGDGAVDDAAVWSLTLAGRVGGLAAVVALTRGSPRLPLELGCPSCQAPLGVELPLDAMMELARRAEDERTVAVPMRDRAPFLVRRPTGEDQRRWQEQRYESPSDAERALLRSLLADAPTVDPPIDDEMMARVSEALEELDPLPGLTVSSRCPECGIAAEHAVDAEAALLGELALEQRALIRDVHRLAARYGWTESDVLAIPDWRRRAYLAWIDEEAP